MNNEKYHTKGEDLTSSLYQELEPEIKKFIDYFYSEQIEKGDFKSIPYLQEETDFITHFKKTGEFSSGFYFKKDKSLTHSNHFYDFKETLVKIGELNRQTKKSILIKSGYGKNERYFTLDTLQEALNIFAEITKDNFFSIYDYKSYLSSKDFSAITTVKGYSILFDIHSIPPEDDVLVVDLHDKILVKYINEKFQYLKDWRNSQLRRYCRNNDIIASVRKIEIIRTIQDSNPTRKPYLVFINRLIKKPDIFKEVISPFLNEDNIDSFVFRCLRILYLSGRRDVNPLLIELRDLPKKKKIDALFFYLKDCWSRDLDFTRIYLDLPKKELEIKEYIKRNHPSYFDYIFPHFFKEQYKKASPIVILPTISIDFQKTFKEYKKSIDILGYHGEEFIYRMLQKENEDKPNITITWNNQKKESSKPFDILLEDGNKKYYIEVKTSINDKTTFTMTEREVNFALHYEDLYTLYHIINFNSNNMGYLDYKNLGNLIKTGKIEIINRTLKANL